MKDLLEHEEIELKQTIAINSNHKKIKEIKRNSKFEKILFLDRIIHPYIKQQSSAQQRPTNNQQVLNKIKPRTTYHAIFH
jgi:hypothetical protein